MANSFVLTLWLTANGPQVTMTVPECYRAGAQWYREAVLWADRSGIEKDGPGYLCVEKFEQARYWRVRR